MKKSFYHQNMARISSNDAGGGYTLPSRTATNAPSYASEIARRPMELPSSSKVGYGLAQPSDSTLTVGRNIQLIGQISTCEKLIVEGRIEADVDSCREIEIASSGTFKGSAEIETATISGIFKGDLVVRHRLTIRKGGRVEGSIKYREIELEPGAIIKGSISPVDDVTQSGE